MLSIDEPYHRPCRSGYASYAARDQGRVRACGPVDRAIDAPARVGHNPVKSRRRSSAAVSMPTSHGLLTAGVYRSPPLKDLGKRGTRMGSDIHDPAILHARWAQVMVETRVGWTESAEGAPDHVMR